MATEEQQLDNEHPSAKHGTDLTTGSIPRHLIAFSIPMLMGSLIQTAYSIVNAVWVGKGLGTAAMAAVTISLPIFFLLMAIAFGLTMASSILVAQSFGAKDFDRLRRVVQNSSFLCFVVSLGLVTIGQFTAYSLLKLMGTAKDVLPLAASYLQVFLWSMPFMFGSFLIASLLRGTGDSKTPLYFQAGGLVLTAILDPLLMFGLLHFPKMGLNGTAVATVISNAAALAAGLVYLHRKRHPVAPDFRRLRIDWEMSWLTLRIGVPSMVQQALVSIGMVVIVGLVNAFGENGAAAYGAAMRIDQLAFMPAMTIGGAVSTLAGQNIGAQRFHRVKETFKWGMIIGCGMTILASLIAVSFPSFLLRFFLNDPKVIALGVPYLHIIGSAYVLFAIMFVANGVINGAGHTMITTLITLVALWGIRVPVAAYLSHSMHRMEGIWYGIVLGFASGTVFSLIYYASGRWKKPLTRQTPVPVEPEVLPMAE